MLHNTGLCPVSHLTGDLHLFRAARFHKSTLKPFFSAKSLLAQLHSVTPDHAPSLLAFLAIWVVPHREAKLHCYLVSQFFMLSCDLSKLFISQWKWKRKKQINIAPAALVQFPKHLLNCFSSSTKHANLVSFISNPFLKEGRGRNKKYKEQESRWGCIVCESVWGDGKGRWWTRYYPQGIIHIMNGGKEREQIRYSKCL